MGTHIEKCPYHSISSPQYNWPTWQFNCQKITVVLKFDGKCDGPPCIMENLFTFQFIPTFVAVCLCWQQLRKMSVTNEHHHLPSENCNKESTSIADSSGLLACWHTCKMEPIKSKNRTIVTAIQSEVVDALLLVMRAVEHSDSALFILIGSIGKP